jgi:hypothetical protein
MEIKKYPNGHLAAEGTPSPLSLYYAPAALNGRRLKKPDAARSLIKNYITFEKYFHQFYMTAE